MASNKHHYVPQCYMRPWTGADDLLCEYQWLGGQVKTRRIHPAGTGWSPNLYSVSSLPPQFVDIIETEVFGRIDQDAANALDTLISGRVLSPGKELDGWSRFLMSLMFRNPVALEEIRQECLSRWADIPWSDEDKANDPEGFADCSLGEKSMHFGGLFLTSVRNVVDMNKIGTILNNMHKGILEVRKPGIRFMTSDNPLFVSGGLGAPDAHVMLPLTPTKLYIGATNRGIIDELTNRGQADIIIKYINNHVVSHSHQFAYGLCENHADFVSVLWPKLA